VAIACGGTGGHIFPGLAVAEELEKQGHAVTLWLTGGDVEKTAVADWKGPVVTVPARGLPRGFSLRAVRRAFQLLGAVMVSRKTMKSLRPDVLLGMGSYACVGPVCAALTLRIPVVFHEANVIPGRAVSLLCRWATAVAVSFTETGEHIKARRIVNTGMPLRDRLRDRQVDANRLANLDREKFTVLVMGGSRGARKLNDVVSETICNAREQGSDLQVIHLTGTADEVSVRAVYERAGVPAIVSAFVQNMGPVYQAADLAVCRSGASTCAELSAFGLPALLVPFPFAIGNHQMSNAVALKACGGADVLPESELSVSWLGEYLQNASTDVSRLASMSVALRKRVRDDSAVAVASLLEDVGA